MLAARRGLLENTKATIGVSQEQQSLVPSESVRGVYFVLSADRHRPPSESNDSDSSESDFMSEKAEGGSLKNSPVPFSVELAGATTITTTLEVHGDLGRPTTSHSPAPCVRPKHGTTIVGLPDKLVTPQAHETKKEKPKKKKKWRAVGAEDMGFKLTLFPRAPVTDEGKKDVEKEEALFFAFEAELELVNQRVRPFQHLLQLEGSGLNKKEKFIRRDSDRRVQKAHRQVKSKNITSLLNNPGRKTLYIHFRLYKLHPFLHCSNLEHPNLPSPPKRAGVCLEVARSAIKAQQKAAVIQLLSASSSTSTSRRRRAPCPQNLAHALDAGNAANELPTDIISFLISIQHREMTPEDYEVLLRLDEGVAPKTVQKDVVSSFEADVVDESSAGGVCSVCMEEYEVGQERKFLPCEHVFHAQCIEMWLTNSSQNCPLDGLPVGFS
ncbi:uncharacterized protein [Littorina saxatilis]|uniref:uncharacterized protein n=1 Tax=Littorina saxatilis TaxID=31220 RepID=UPI0038B4577A